MSARHTRSVPRAPRQRGVALLTAMLTVTLVATFAAAALWQQWRAAELEAAERTRMQSAWVLVGALDWSRLILREDGRASPAGVGADHLAEPWAVPLEEARLSSFLAADKNIASDALEGLPDAFLSGRIVDAQSKLNVTNLVGGNKPVPTAVAAFTRLFGMLGLPAQEVPLLAANLQRARAGIAPSNPAAAAGGGAPGAGATGTPPDSTTAGGGGGGGGGGSGGGSGGGTGSSQDSETDDSNAPLLPQRVDQLVWLGLSPSTVAAIAPYVTVLPDPTAVNINTASAEVLAASVPSLDLAGAQRLVTQRQQRFFATTADAARLLPEGDVRFVEGQHSVNTSFFEVHGRLRLDKIWVEETSLLRRNATTLTVVWRERGVGALAQAQAVNR